MSNRLRFSIQTDEAEASNRNQVCTRKLYRLPPRRHKSKDEIDVPDILVPVEFTQEELDQLSRIAESRGITVDECITEAVEDFIEDMYFNRVADERLKTFEDNPVPLSTLEDMKKRYGFDG